MATTLSWNVAPPFNLQSLFDKILWASLGENRNEPGQVRKEAAAVFVLGSMIAHKNEHAKQRL